MAWPLKTYIIGFLDLHELFMCGLVLVSVRMPLLCELVIRFLNVTLRGILLDSQHAVWVLGRACSGDRGSVELSLRTAEGQGASCKSGFNEACECVGEPTLFPY